MKIHDPTREEIEQKYRINLIEQLKTKIEKGELESAIENDDIAIIPVSIHDNATIGLGRKKY